MADPQRPPVRLPAGAGAGTAACRASSSDRVHLPRATSPPAAPGAASARRTRPPARPAPAARRGRGARTAALARRGAAAGPGPIPPARPPTPRRVDGRKSTKSAASTDEKSKNWWVRSSASTAWKARPTTTPRCRVRRNSSSHGIDSSIAAVATITAHSSPAAPSSWSADEPDGVGGLVGSRRWRSSPTGRRTPS